jgi:hypothetical protein
MWILLTSRVVDPAELLDRFLGGRSRLRLVGSVQLDFLLLRRGREDDGVRSEGVRELHTHVAQPAEAEDADLLAPGDAEAAQRRIGRDPRTQERRSAGGIQVVRDAQDEVLIDGQAPGPYWSPLRPCGQSGVPADL